MTDLKTERDLPNRIRESLLGSSALSSMGATIPMVGNLTPILRSNYGSPNSLRPKPNTSRPAGRWSNLTHGDWCWQKTRT
jgi:hypothetical protein